MKKILSLLFALMVVISINAEELYLVGDATPIGWTGDGSNRQNTRMTEVSPGVFVWTGLLRHGNEGFKICNSYDGWEGYHPSTQDMEMPRSGSDYYTEDNYSDWKWNPQNESWKYYTVTLDKNTGKISWKRATVTLLEAVDGAISIGTAEELYTLAFMLRNNVNNESYNVKLTADIDYTAYKDGSMAALGVGEILPFRGEFDGQNHTITVDLESYSERFSLFGTIDGKVHNLNVAGKITAINHNQTGGICGLLKANGSKIYNCVSEVEIVDNQSGDGTIGGICAVSYHYVSIENCAFYGKINAPNRDGNGGIVAYAQSGASTVIKNCLIVANIDWNTGSTNNDDFGRNHPSVINCFKVNDDDPTLPTGEMTYQLNNFVSGSENWFQTLGVDVLPSPFSTSAKLYVNGSFYCDGVTPKEGVDIVLSNTDAAIVDPHVFGEDGICINCLAVGQKPEADDGIFQIVNPGNMIWLAQYVNAGNVEANAVLLKDIDLTAINYTPIGIPGNMYEGTFDGQGHVVTLNLDNPDLNFQGLFGVATDGATIKNVIVRGSVSGYSYVAGIVGGSNGGTEGKTLSIINCANEATINAASTNGGGIIGVNMGGTAHFYISNCYNIGNITSTREGGAISGWIGGNEDEGLFNSTIENTYNIGVVTNTVINEDGVMEDFVRGYGIIYNSYNLLATNPAVTNGELAYILGNAFGQLIGTDPYPTFDGESVYYVGDAGYSTMYDPYNNWELNGDVRAFIGAFKSTWLNLTEIDNVPAGSPVVLKGSYYNKLELSVNRTTVDFFTMGYENAQILTGSTICVDDLDINFDQGTGSTPTTYYNAGTAVRIYGGNTMSIYAAGQPITKIVFNFRSGNAPKSSDIEFNEGNYDFETSTWTGNAETVTLTRKGSSGHYRLASITVTYGESALANTEGNVLMGTAEETEAAGKFVLAKPWGEQIGFYLAESGTIAAGKAYLSSCPDGVKVFFFEDDDATGINSATLNDEEQMINDNVIYNLAGQRIGKMQKGINIVNGKKILK